MRFHRSIVGFPVLLGIVMLMVAGLPRLLSADPIVIYSNFGPDPGYDATQGWRPQANRTAYYMRFQPTQDAQLTSVTFPVLWGTRVGSTFPVWLVHGNTPIEILNPVERLPGSAPEGAQPGQVSLITVQSRVQPILYADTAYFFGVLATPGTWLWNNAGVSGTIHESSFNSRTFEGPLSAFQIHGDPSVVPEPGTLALIAGGAGILICRRRRRSSGEFVDNRPPRLTSYD